MAGTSLPLKDHWLEQKLFFSRIIAAAVIVVLLSGLLVARLVQLQIVNYERFSELSQGNRFRIEPLPPNRGLIFDRNGLVIADNLPNWELVAVAEEIENLDKTLTQLEDLGLVDPSEHNTLRDLVRSHRGFERVKLSNLTEEQAATFAVRRHRFAGVDIQEALVRHYPFGEKSAHAIGYVGSISLADLQRIDRSDYAATSQIGKSGVERSYEGELHGHVGYRHQVVNAQGRVLFDPALQDQVNAANAAAGVPTTKAPIPGKNVVLALDMRLQLAAQEALGDLRGAVVAIDPRDARGGGARADRIDHRGDDQATAVGDENRLTRFHAQHAREVVVFVVDEIDRRVGRAESRRMEEEPVFAHGERRASVIRRGARVRKATCRVPSGAPLPSCSPYPEPTQPRARAGRRGHGRRGAGCPCP